VSTLTPGAPVQLAPAPALKRLPRLWASIFSARARAGELAWVMAGKFGMLGANAALMLLLAQRLELAAYGQFVTLISGQLLLSRVLMPGIECGVTRLRTLPAYRLRGGQLTRAGLQVIWGLGAIAALGALAICLVWEALGEPHWWIWLTAAMVGGALGTALVDFCYRMHLAQLRYRAATTAQSGTALLRLTALAPLALWWPQQTWLLFLLYPIVTLLAGLLQTWLLKLPRGAGFDFPMIGELLRYSGWQAVTNIAAVLSLYQGTFVLNFYGQAAATGLFGLGLSMSQGFFAINNAYTEYLLPRAVRAGHLRELRSFLRRTLFGSLLLASGGVLATLVLGQLIQFLKPELHTVEPIFYCLAAALLLLSFQAPLSAAIHYLMRPQLLTCGGVLLVICTGSLSLWLAPAYGAWGAALGQLGGTALALLLLVILLALAWRSAQHAETDLFSQQTKRSGSASCGQPAEQNPCSLTNP
jgi:O-antigen/teichoic acid export membrane protein